MRGIGQQGYRSARRSKREGQTLSDHLRDAKHAGQHGHRHHSTAYPKQSASGSRDSAQQPKPRPAKTRSGHWRNRQSEHFDQVIQGDREEKDDKSPADDAPINPDSKHCA